MFYLVIFISGVVIGVLATVNVVTSLMPSFVAEPLNNALGSCLIYLLVFGLFVACASLLMAS